MDFNKKTFIFALIIGLVMLLLSIYIEFFTLEFCENLKHVLDFTKNILLNILASAIFLVFTSWFNYFTQKSIVKRNLLNETLKIRNLFENTVFEYNKSDSYGTFCYSNNYFSDITEDERKQLYEQYEKSKKISNANKILETFNTYNNILNYDFEYLKTSIEDLSCFSDFIISKKLYIQINLISYLDIIRLNLKKYENTINAIISGSCLDYDFLLEKVSEIQNEIFLNHDIAPKLTLLQQKICKQRNFVISQQLPLDTKNVVIERLDRIIDKISHI